MKKALRSACGICRTLLPLTLWFQVNAADSNSQIDPLDLFSKGSIELATGSSVMFSPFVATHHRPTFNYATGFFQIGYMMTDPHDYGILRGNVETIGEFLGGGFFAGRANYIAGGTLWLRYNCLQPTWRVTPYAQLGAGALMTDIDRKIAGQTFNFNLGAATGFRYFVTPSLALNLEYRFQHISNANIGEHNLGLNAQGPVLAMSWAF